MTGRVTPPAPLRQINLVVRDMDVSLAFYRRLGWTIDTPTTIRNVKTVRLDPDFEERIQRTSPTTTSARFVLEGLELPLTTTWPAFTEAMYLLARAGGQRGQAALWKLVLSDRLEIAELPRSAPQRSSRLMTKYADLPLDLVDATVGRAGGTSWRASRSTGSTAAAVRGRPHVNTTFTRRRAHALISRCDVRRRSEPA